MEVTPGPTWDIILCKCKDGVLSTDECHSSYSFLGVI